MGTHREGVCRAPGAALIWCRVLPGGPDIWILRSVSTLAARLWTRSLPSLDLHCLRGKNEDSETSSAFLCVPLFLCIENRVK